MFSDRMAGDIPAELDTEVDAQSSIESPHTWVWIFDAPARCNTRASACPGIPLHCFNGQFPDWCAL